MLILGKSDVPVNYSTLHFTEVFARGIAKYRMQATSIPVSKNQKGKWGKNAKENLQLERRNVIESKLI